MKKLILLLHATSHILLTYTLQSTAKAEINYPKWTPIEAAPSSQNSIRWTPVIERQSHHNQVDWVKVEDDNLSPSPSQLASQHKSPPSYPVTGGVFHIKRNNEFLPAITHFIPSGYGAAFKHFSAGLWLEDCLTAGGKLCGGRGNEKYGGQNWIEEFEDWGKGRVVLEVGLGDPNQWFGLDAAFQFTSLATTRPGKSAEGTPFGSGQGLDLSISRNITPDWGVKLGARNIAKFDNVQLDSGRSAFLVTTKRLDLGGDREKNTNDLYITLGLGNGRMRPLRAIVEDQKRECDKDERKYGRRTTSPYVVHCLERGFDYGTPWPIASVSYMVNDQISLISEWWGRNLLLGASIKPIKDVNWVISPAVTSIIHNSDWDPKVPGYTERMRFNLSTSIGF